MLVSLMKQHGIKRVIASPGTTNIAIVGSLQHDSWFDMYSSVDERSAAYMACGMAEESGEPVAIICTGATASRNYLPGLTEAYYRKLPILAICGSHGEQYIGHLHSQVIDRTNSANDTVLYKAFINPVNDKSTQWYNNVEINKAILKLRQHGGGPALINIVASPNAEFATDELPKVRAIKLHSSHAEWPTLSQGRIAIFLGSHVQMKSSLQRAIDNFCSSHNAVVFCDKTGGYQGRYQFNSTLVCCQHNLSDELLNIDLLIHIGEVSGDTYTTLKIKPKKVWRISEDGEARDLFRKLTDVFESDEEVFFNYYSSELKSDNSYIMRCKNIYDEIYKKIPELYFGNIYVAKEFSRNLPKNSVIHFGIYNSLRSWNFFNIDSSIQSSCNVGGFGIDGACSTLIGAALMNKEKIHFLNVGDLAFFYDLNSLGNRHLPQNVRIILINNGRGVEFRKKDHPGSKFGDEADLFMSAAGHFGNQSINLVKQYSESLGIEYLSASSKTELKSISAKFLTSEITDKPMLLEIFPDFHDDVESLDIIRNIIPDERSLIKKMSDTMINEIKDMAKVGYNNVKMKI